MVLPRFTLLLGPYAGQVVALAGGVICLYGAWLLTRRDPSGIGEDQYGTVRQLIRVALVAGLASSVLQSFNATGAATTTGGDTLRVVLTIAVVGTGLIGVAGQFAMLRYLEKLTLRIPDPAMSRRARVLSWGYGCSLAAMVVVGGAAGLVGTYAARPGGAAGSGATGAGMGTMIAAGNTFAFAAFVSLLVFGIVFLVLLHRLSRVFAEQARLAAEAWTRRDSPT
jgi:hypothetical protein